MTAYVSQTGVTLQSWRCQTPLSRKKEYMTPSTAQTWPLNTVLLKGTFCIFRIQFVWLLLYVTVFCIVCPEGVCNKAQLQQKPRIMTLFLNCCTGGDCLKNSFSQCWGPCAHSALEWLTNIFSQTLPGKLKINDFHYSRHFDQFTKMPMCFCSSMSLQLFYWKMKTKPKKLSEKIWYQCTQYYYSSILYQSSSNWTSLL